MQSAICNPQSAIPSLVVIGASLGGLRAVTSLLAALPADFPAALIVVQHRAEDADDTLVGLLQEHTALPVREPEDKDPILAGHVYLAPAGYHLLVERGLRSQQSAICNLQSEIHFALSTEAPVNYARPSIDVLFESAADAYRERAIGVILTGANADGAAGLAAIKRRGGLAIVQDPATAEAAAMPQAAIAGCAVDHILPLAEIAPLLLDFRF